MKKCRKVLAVISAVVMDSKGIQREGSRILRAFKIELGIAGALSLLALIGGCFLWSMDRKGRTGEIGDVRKEDGQNLRKNYADDTQKKHSGIIEHEKTFQQCRDVTTAQNRRSLAREKEKEKELADKCEDLALERLHETIGKEGVWKIYNRRNNVHSHYNGIEAFTTNFERATLPFSTNDALAINIAARREKVFEKYLNESKAVGALSAGPQQRDEFETEAEYKLRRAKEKRTALELKEKLDEARDEILAFEKTCNSRVFRCSMDDFYMMKEALVFIPKTDWVYEAEEHQFCVSGRDASANRQGLAEYNRFEGFREEPMQGFQFSVNKVPITQIVKSKTIKYKYKLRGGDWDHPRVFKEYKQHYPFLLVRLGLCDVKVQGVLNQVVVMPWNREEKASLGAKVQSPHVVKASDSESKLRDPNYGAVNRATREPVHGHRILETAFPSDSSFAASVRAKRNEDVWCRAEKSQIAGEFLFSAETTVERKSDEPLLAVATFADYKTPEGRAAIEDVLKHFEKVGGLYYREFCKAVRYAMEREACEDASTWTYK